MKKFIPASPARTFPSELSPGGAFNWTALWGLRRYCDDGRVVLGYAYSGAEGDMNSIAATPIAVFTAGNTSWWPWPDPHAAVELAPYEAVQEYHQSAYSTTSPILKLFTMEGVTYAFSARFLTDYQAGLAGGWIERGEITPANFEGAYPDPAPDLTAAVPLTNWFQVADLGLLEAMVLPLELRPLKNYSGDDKVLIEVDKGGEGERRLVLASLAGVVGSVGGAYDAVARFGTKGIAVHVVANGEAPFPLLVVTFIDFEAGTAAEIDAVFKVGASEYGTATLPLYGKGFWVDCGFDIRAMQDAFRAGDGDDATEFRLCFPQATSTGAYVATITAEMVNEAAVSGILAVVFEDDHLYPSYERTYMYDAAQQTYWCAINDVWGGAPRFFRMEDVPPSFFTAFDGTWEGA